MRLKGTAADDDDVERWRFGAFFCPFIMLVTAGRIEERLRATRVPDRRLKLSTLAI